MASPHPSCFYFLLLNKPTSSAETYTVTTHSPKSPKQRLSSLALHLSPQFYSHKRYKMCRYIHMRFTGCNHSRTAMLYRCDSNPKKNCPARCFRPFIEPYQDETMPSKCPECDPNPSTEPIGSPSTFFNFAFRGLAKDLISRGQWISYTEMQMAFRKLFHWDMPAVPMDRLFNEDGEASSRLTPLKRDMMEEMDMVIILTRQRPPAIHAPIWFG